MKVTDLVINTDSYDEELVAQTLYPFLRIGSNGSVRFLPDSMNLDVRKKILLYLLAQEAMRHESITSMVSEITPILLSNELKIKGGTLRPILKILKDAKFIVSENGYKINVLALNEVRDIFLKEVKINAKL